MAAAADVEVDAEGVNDSSEGRAMRTAGLFKLQHKLNDNLSRLNTM